MSRKHKAEEDLQKQEIMMNIDFLPADVIGEIIYFLHLWRFKTPILRH